MKYTIYKKIPTTNFFSFLNRTSFDEGGTATPSGGKDTTFSHNKIHFRRKQTTLKCEGSTQCVLYSKN